MMLLGPDNKKNITAVIVERLKGGAKMKGDSEKGGEYKNDAGLDACASSMISSLKSGDSKGLAAALKDAIEMILIERETMEPLDKD